MDCNGHTKYDGSWWEHDARGLPLCRVCEECRSIKLHSYRSDVLTDSNYWADVPIDEEC